MAELPLPKNDQGLIKGNVYPREAAFYKRLYDGYLQCILCHHSCKIAPAETGLCKSRINDAGKLYTIAFSNPCAVHVILIEKEPMFHFFPGTTTLSIAIAGCNFRCSYCQNWLITQFSPKESMNYFRSPKEIIELANMNSCVAINYTFSEPTVFYEYMLDVSGIAKDGGLKNICHTNGFLTEEPLRKICKFLDAICVDLKSLEENFYRNVCGGNLEPVLKSLKIIKEEGVHLEIVNLIIPSYNDDLSLIKKMCDWIVENLGPEIPLHFLGFRPRHKFKDLRPIELDILEEAHNIALSSGLYYPFLSDNTIQKGKTTYCPFCKNILIKRERYEVIENNVVNGKCRFCASNIKGYRG